MNCFFHQEAWLYITIEKISRASIYFIKIQNELTRAEVILNLVKSRFELEILCGDVEKQSVITLAKQSTVSSFISMLYVFHQG